MGTLINMAAIFIGGILGLLVGKAISKRFQDILYMVCGISTLFIGIGGVMQHMLTIEGSQLNTQGTMMVLASLTIGALIGEGINIEKQFMPSVADTTSVNLRNYKVVRNGQFAYSSMQTGRDECIRIALYDKDDPILISPAYSVLQVKDSAAVAEYIMLWFTRPETDRYGWFASDASVRANLDLDRFYEIQIPLPDTAKQQAIANIYIAYMLRREINEQLKAQIKDICPILIKGSIDEASA